MRLALLAQVPEFGFSIVGLLIGIVDYTFYILFGAILISIVIGWFGYPSSGFMQAVYNVVRSIADPILMPIRSRIPMLKLGGFGLDLSPIIAIIGLSIARRVLTLIITEFIGPMVGG